MLMAMITLFLLLLGNVRDVCRPMPEHTECFFVINKFLGHWATLLVFWVRRLHFCDKNRLKQRAIRGPEAVPLYSHSDPSA